MSALQNIVGLIPLFPQAVQNLIKNHSSFEKLLGVQNEKLKSITDFGDKLVQEGNFDSENITKRIDQITGQ